MPNSQLSDLIKLVDDESIIVRRALAEELIAYGDRLEDEIEKQNDITYQEKRQLYEVLESYLDNWLVKKWSRFLEQTAEEDFLEEGLSLLADYLDQLRRKKPLREYLDDLISEYEKEYEIATATELAKFLFGSGRLKGAASEYYHPKQSNLIDVIESGDGIPISLACIYILVGKRMNIYIEGCNFPGHFLARFHHKDDFILVDCFNKGKLLDWRDIAEKAGEKKKLRSGNCSNGGYAG